MELEFRAWNKIHKKIYKVYSIDFENGLVFCESKEDTRHTFGMIDCIIDQFTGRYDKNRGKIYCSDLVNTKYYGIKLMGENLMACAINGLFNHPTNEDEILGNNHENPELLK